MEYGVLYNHFESPLVNDVMRKNTKALSGQGFKYLSNWRGSSGASMVCA